MQSEVLTEDFRPIPGLTRGDADSIGNDGTRQEQTWAGDATAIDRVKGERIRLKFYLDSFDLYSFRASV